jgi:uncharacterized protein DUF4258
MLGGPKNAHEALSWIKEAVREGRYIRTKHFFERMTERVVTLADVAAALRRASRCETYSQLPRHGGSCWRVHGQDLDGRRLAVGVEAFLDEERRWTILCTVMELKK